MLILNIEREIVFNGRQGVVTWFHPKVGLMPPQQDGAPPWP